METLVFDLCLGLEAGLFDSLRPRSYSRVRPLDGSQGEREGFSLGFALTLLFAERRGKVCLLNSRGVVWSYAKLY